MYLCTKDWDIFITDCEDNYILLAKGLLGSESAIEFFCALFILFG